MQVDRDGTTADLGTVPLNFDLTAIHTIAYPNPTTDQLDISFAPGRFDQLILSDSQGKILQHRAISPTEPHQKLSLLGLPKGTYILSLKGNDRTEQLKVAKR